MAERRTILSSAGSKTNAIDGPSVRAPAAAFGEYSGMDRLGRGLQDLGNTGANIAANQLGHMRQIADRRDAHDFRDRLQLAINEEGLGLEQDFLEATTAGMAYEPLMEHINGKAKERLAKVDEKLADLRVRNPKMFDTVLSPAARQSAWMSRSDNVAVNVLHHNARRTRDDRFATAVKNDEILFAATAGNPAGVMGVADTILKKMDEDAALYSPDQMLRRRAVVQKQVYDNLYAGAMNMHAGTPKLADAARDRGLIGPTEHARIYEEYARNSNPANLNAESRSTAKNLAESVAGGNTAKDPATSTQIVKNAADTYVTPAEKYDQVIKPQILALMQGDLRSNIGQGLMAAGDTTPGNAFRRARDILVELDKPESPGIKAMFEKSYEDKSYKFRLNNPGLTPELNATHSMRPSAKDYEEYKATLKAVLTDQIQKVDNWQAHELYKDNPGVRQAINSGNTATLVRVQRSLYDRDGVPEDRRVYGDPDEIRAISDRMKLTDEASVGKTAEMVTKFVEKFGRDSYGALISTAQSPGPMSGVVRFTAQQFATLNKEASHDILSLVPEMIQAVAWNGSALAKEVTEKNPDFTKQTKTFWNAAASSGYAGEYSAKAAFGDFLDGDLRVNPESSPFGQAAIREGTYSALHDLGQALTNYYAAGKKDMILRPSEAASRARDVIGRAFIPVATNGGGNDNPIYTFAPVTNKQTAWFQTASAGAFNNQRHYAKMEQASFDSMFITENPKFGVGGAIQWQFNLALTHAFNGVKFGFDTELAQMPNLDPTFSMTARTAAGIPTTAFGTSPIDFANTGVLTKNAKGEDEFIPLSEDRIVTDFLPVTVRERMDALLKATDKTDSRGRSQLILGNNYQREFDTKSQSWDIYLSSGRNYAGNAGTLSKVGPRASVVVRQKDGTFKKLSIPLTEANNRLEAMMAASSGFNRAGSNNQLRKELIQEMPKVKKN